ncbi:MAG TPA: DinB family protein [Thermoanaerobaculaceae bacterium]|nr:DinB family protein [Thermoanaerobaculaceae bacterium]
MTVIRQPEATEYAPYYERYVALVRGSDILETLERQKGAFRRALSGLPDDRAGFRYAPEKWTIREVVGHCIDAERVFAYRALCFARGEKAPLPAFDENEYARQSGHDAVSLGELLDEFESVRAATLAQLRHLPDHTWLQIGVASGKPVSVRALSFIMAGHVEHHLAILHERYAVPTGA